MDLTGAKMESPPGIWREKYTGAAARGEAKRLRQQFLNELSAGTLPIDMAEISERTKHGARKAR